MMNTTRKAIFLAIAVPIVLHCQPPMVLVPNVDEPPELLGPAKKYTPPSNVFLEFGKAVQFDKWKETDPENIKSVRVGLTTFIDQHPGFSAAYMMRAMGDFCFLGSKDYEAVRADIESAIKTISPNVGENMLQTADLLAMRGKVQIESGHLKEALDDLEAAMKTKLDNADQIFGSGDTKPEITNANRCVWTTSNFDQFSQKFPQDYRVPLLRSLYLKSQLSGYKSNRFNWLEEVSKSSS